MAAVDKNQSTPYDLIRPVWPLTWDESVFDRFDTTVTKKHNMVPKNRKPAAYAPNEFIPDTLNQAYLDAINVNMSPIRVNQAGYMESDPEKQFYYIGTATEFEVVDKDGKSLSPKVTGPLDPTGHSISSDWTIIAGTNAATNDQKRYQVDITGQSGMVQKGFIPGNVPTETRLRIKVGNDISSTFIVSDRVYSMVRSAALKFYGINRSGNGESWFHPASHMKDGAGPVVTGAEDVRDFSQYNAALEGTLQGGYYDCGDHLKESQTQMYAFMVAAVMAATNPDADEDVYAYNQSESQNTDGIPDMLREAKHGADYVLRAYNRAKGVIDDMALSVGNFGSDHGWWGRPENSDKLPIDGSAAATDRGGPASRTVRLGEIGANIGGETAAGLAILGKDYAMYDKAFADSCLMVAEKMYDFAKSMAQGKVYTNNKEAAGWSSPAYNGNNEYFDDLALASVALWYATGKKEYGDDAIRNKNLGTTVPQSFMDCVGCFEGGWFVTDNKGFLKNVKNTSWANSYAYATYALYKLILADKDKAINVYGLTETEWSNAIEDCVMSMIHNLSDVSLGAGTASITLPRKDSSNYMVQDIGWKGHEIKFDPLWYSMNTDQTWIYNRYQAGNTFEVLAYADVTADISKKGYVLPNLGSPDWKSDQMHQLGINQLNYLLGVNPWDVSYILGIGDKNDNHPHHRAANPEGKNQPGAAYKYNPPVGALYGGVTPGTTNSIVPDNKSWEDYHKSETCIDAAATLVSSGAIAAAKFDRTTPPKVSVEIRHVSADSAIVMVKLTGRGFAELNYGTSETSMKTTAQPDTVKAGMQHEIILRGLEKGTTYYFYAVGQNAYAEDSITVKYMVDSTQTPFSFTTLNTIENAQITNITVCNLFGDTAEVMWYTPNGEYESKIYWDTVAHASAEEYAFNSGSGNADISGIPTKFHYVKIGGLKEKTTYYYMVESNGAQQNVDDKGNLLKFTTPVGWYDFSVRAYQYDDGGLDFLNMNIYNNEARPFDSLTLRIYFNATPDQVEKCATLFDSDICQAYDEAGFNRPCENDRELRDLARAALPIRLDDTYNAADGSYAYYFPVPLGSSTIKSQSRLRVDLRFSEGISNDGFKTCETLGLVPAKKRFNKNTGDWSWRPHTFQEDGADYDGLPLESKDYGDIDGDIPVNPYITVYRKGEFIWGYSPSAQEMSTKKAHYEMDVVYDAPFNVSDGSYVQIDQTSSTVWVTGHAHVTEGGYLTKIWANGNLVDATPVIISGERFLVSSEGTIIAHYNSGEGDKSIDSLGLWTLNIPVKMGIGSNKIDITLFAGADPECQECTENGGCAFVNRSYYVQFTRGNLTASALTIKNEQGKAVESPADTKGTNFFIYLTDKDKANYKGDLKVKVINAKKQDTLLVKMTEDAANPGSFSSTKITAIAIAKNIRNNSQISFYPGDTIQVVYLDPDDEEDVSKQTFFAESSMPTPQKILAQDTDCDNIADQLLVQFNNALSANYSFDSIRVFINGMKDTATIAVDAAKAIDQTDIEVKLPGTLGIPEDPAPMGKATLFMKVEGTVNSEKFDITDGIPPRLQSVTILENPADPVRAEYDTVMISFTEPVQPFRTWPLAVYGLNGAAIDQSSIQVIGSPTTENEGKSYMFVISGNDDGKILPIGGQVIINSAVRISDNNFNVLIPNQNCKQVFIAETPKPIPVKFAEMIDYEGDGYPDELRMLFEKKFRNRDVLDSFVVEWGYNSETRSFVTKADTSSLKIVPDNNWSIRDSVGEEYTIMIDSVTSVVRDTMSIVTIKIPSSNSFSKGATTGPYEDANGHRTGRVTPRMGPEGGFFDKKYPVEDKCPPVVLSAVWRNFEIAGKQNDILDVEISEPLDTVAQNTDYFERLRNGVPNTYYSPKTNVALNAARTSAKSYALTYKHDNPDAFWLSDSIRLVPYVERSFFTDKAGLFPGAGSPWVPVVGRITKAKFKVDVVRPEILGGQENFYAGEKLPVNQHFRLSLKDKDNANLLIAAGGHKLQKVEGSVPVANYGHRGPVFKLEITLPDVMSTTQLGEMKRNYEVSLSLDLFSNTGTYVNSTSFKFNPLDYANYITSANSSLVFYLEWCAPDDYPLSSENKKIATGPYISKFTAKIKGKYIAATPDSDDDNKAINANESITKTFGFRRVKK